MRTESPKGVVQITLSSELKFDNSALQTYHRGVGSVVGAQFGEDVSNPALDRFFGDRQLIRDLLIRISGGN